MGFPEVSLVRAGQLCWTRYRSIYIFHNRIVDLDTVRSRRVQSLLIQWMQIPHVAHCDLGRVCSNVAVTTAYILSSSFKLSLKWIYK
jgi:hypothetical protein